MPRCAITTLASFRKAAKGLPGDCIISTNHVGNLAILKPIGGAELEMIGYITLMNVEDYDGSNLRDCELTLIADESDDAE